MMLTSVINGLEHPTGDHMGLTFAVRWAASTPGGRLVVDDVVRDVGGVAGVTVLRRVAALGAGLVLALGVGRGPWVAVEVP